MIHGPRYTSTGQCCFRACARDYSLPSGTANDFQCAEVGGPRRLFPGQGAVRGGGGGRTVAIETVLGRGWVRGESSGPSLSLQLQGTETLQPPPPLDSLALLPSVSPAGGRDWVGREEDATCGWLLDRNRRNFKKRNGNLKKEPSHLGSRRGSRRGSRSHRRRHHGRHPRSRSRSLRRYPSGRRRRRRLSQSHKMPKTLLLSAPPGTFSRIPKGQAPTRTDSKDG